MSASYPGDYYTWLARTAELLSDGRAGELSSTDLAQIAEELRDMGRSEQRSVESYMERIMVYLLKMKHQPGKHTRSWDLSIATSRVRLRKLFQESPSLAAQPSEWMPEAYETARLVAARQTGLALDNFPVECPFRVEEVLE